MEVIWWVATQESPHRDHFLPHKMALILGPALLVVRKAKTLLVDQAVVHQVHPSNRQI